MTLHFSRKPKDPKEIRSDAERQRASAQVDFLHAAIKRIQSSKATRRNADTALKCRQMLTEREAEIRDYDALKSGVLTLPKLNRLDEVAAFIPRIRISRGVSQTELARRLGVSKQVVSRYEESRYQTVGLVRLQEILDALGAKTHIDLSLQRSA